VSRIAPWSAASSRVGAPASLAADLGNHARSTSTKRDEMEQRFGLTHCCTTEGDTIRAAMFVDYRGSILGLLRWQWKPALLFLISSSVIVTLEHFFVEHLEHTLLPVTPVTPVAVVGGTIAIFVSFRTNSSYDRW
jgi:Bestrophin, RFP-TM, chloride channel